MHFPCIRNHFDQYKVHGSFWQSWGRCYLLIQRRCATKNWFRNALLIHFKILTPAGSPSIVISKKVYASISEIQCHNYKNWHVFFLPYIAHFLKLFYYKKKEVGVYKKKNDIILETRVHIYMFLIELSLNNVCELKA